MRSIRDLDEILISGQLLLTQLELSFRKLLSQGRPMIGVQSDSFRIKQRSTTLNDLYKLWFIITNHLLLLCTPMFGDLDNGPSRA